MSHSSAHPGLAAVLSFVIPGMGQIYNGNFIRAAFWLLIAFWLIEQPMAWPMNAGFWQWMTHLLPALTAFNKARQMELVRAWKRDMANKIGGDNNSHNSGRIIDQ